MSQWIDRSRDAWQSRVAPAQTVMSKCLHCNGTYEWNRTDCPNCGATARQQINPAEPPRPRQPFECGQDRGVMVSSAGPCQYTIQVFQLADGSFHARLNITALTMLPPGSPICLTGEMPLPLVMNPEWK